MGRGTVHGQPKDGRGQEVVVGAAAAVVPRVERVVHALHAEHAHLCFKATASTVKCQAEQPQAASKCRAPGPHLWRQVRIYVTSQEEALWVLLKPLHLYLQLDRHHLPDNRPMTVLAAGPTDTQQLVGSKYHTPNSKERCQRIQQYASIHYRWICSLHEVHKKQTSCCGFHLFKGCTSSC